MRMSLTRRGLLGLGDTRQAPAPGLARSVAGHCQAQPGDLVGDRRKRHLPGRRVPVSHAVTHLDRGEPKDLLVRDVEVAGLNTAPENVLPEVLVGIADANDPSA